MNLPSHLIIPDPHAHPEHDNKRFTLLGKYAAEERPSAIICIGDLFDMPSLSHYDQGKKSFEGRRYQLDIDAGHEALDLIDNELEKASGWKPRKIFTLGNHEYRIIKATNDIAMLDGKLGLPDLQLEAHGWEVHPFLEPVVVDTISYAHYFVSGVMGRGIGGENIGKTMCNKLHASAVQGHSHIYDHSERAIINGLRIFGLSCGCYTHPDMIEDWNRSFVQMWWRGLVQLRDLDGAGYYDEIRTITLRKLTRDFSYSRKRDWYRRGSDLS